MTSFRGFPSGGRAVPVPAAFFAEALPAITDLAEAKVTLHVMWRLSERRAYPRFVTGSELDTDRILLLSLGTGAPALQEARRGLKLAVARGTLLERIVERGDRTERLYFLNTEQDRKASARLEAGEIDIGQTAVRRPAAAPAPRPSVFTLYEQNI
ncbi:MAG: primosomal replication protein N, partial [Dehalococcoidia bacterium]|nr:primosomal replication protein N [Dehalococcoidia bacterium]